MGSGAAWSRRFGDVAEGPEGPPMGRRCASWARPSPPPSRAPRAPRLLLGPRSPRVSLARAGEEAGTLPRPVGVSVPAGPFPSDFSFWGLDQRTLLGARSVLQPWGNLD